MTQPTDWFSRYKWCEPIAQGGMGVVYLAEDKFSNNSKCVIKQLRSDSASEEEAAESMRLFRRESQILKELDHAGIVRFFDDFVSPDGKLFLVMDYIEGNNLETILQNFGPFSQDDAIKVSIQICEVLEYLHERTPPILYRDLKPSNLMLTPDGQIVFIDFGIARVFMEKESATRVVTAGYSPPEQYFGKPETRSDLYALGTTMSHIITGMRPRPLMTCVPIKELPNMLLDLNTLITELTSHSPEDRPRSARVVRHRLYRIYQQLHPDFEIPDDAFVEAPATYEEQSISKKLRKLGLDAKHNSETRLPQEKGPDSQVFDDDSMPTTVKKIFSDVGQRLSSSKVKSVQPPPTTTQPERNLRPKPGARAIEPDEKPSFWSKLFMKKDK